MAMSRRSRHLIESVFGISVVGDGAVAVSCKQRPCIRLIFVVVVSGSDINNLAMEIGWWTDDCRLMFVGDGDDLSWDVVR